ncbi:MAG: hypothetical protein JRJ29_00330 [Deltaproteobacteria bacterium]|nr:hypothetical protein [Deltaproteobacteria bacterium]MBW2081613.1 hypothetical protein [Deltaproteobacteria bacterium]
MNKYYELMLIDAAEKYTDDMAACPFCEAVTQNADDMAALFKIDDLSLKLNQCENCIMVNLAKRWGFIDEGGGIEFQDLSCEAIGRAILYHWEDGFSYLHEDK